MSRPAEGGRLVALLQGINLGKRRVKMDRLRELFAELGLENVESYLASGNLVFDDPGTLDVPGDDRADAGHNRAGTGADRRALERTVEDRLAGSLGFEVATFVRSLDELARLLEAEAVAEAEAEGLTTYVTFLREEPGPDVADALAALATEDDRFHLSGRQVFWLRRGGISDTTISRRERDVAFGGAERTRRKLTTVRRLVAKFGD